MIHDLIKPRKFNCVAAEFHLPCRGIYQIRRGICQIFPRKTVGPTINHIGGSRIVTGSKCDWRRLYYLVRVPPVVTNPCELGAGLKEMLHKVSYPTLR